MHGLGRLFDIGIGFVPVDLNTADGATGKRISLQNFSAITFLAVVGVAAGGTDDLTLDVQQHTAASGGTSADLDSAAVTGSKGITKYWYKRETALDNDEPWVGVTQSEASEITLAGATYAALQYMIAFEVNAAQLGDGYTHVSVVATVSTTNARLGALLYIPHGLRYERSPENLDNLLAPGVANA